MGGFLKFHDLFPRTAVMILPPAAGLLRVVAGAVVLSDLVEQLHAPVGLAIERVGVTWSSAISEPSLGRAARNHRSYPA